MKSEYTIERYSSQHEQGIMDVIHAQGEDWEIYWGKDNEKKYRQCLADSITYVAIQNEVVCGYIRSIPDALFIYVCDLLVDEGARGNGLGKRLMDCTAKDYPDQPLYVMSGNDEYYEKIGAKREGSIYTI